MDSFKTNNQRRIPVQKPVLTPDRSYFRIIIIIPFEISGPNHKFNHSYFTSSIQKKKDDNKPKIFTQKKAERIKTRKINLQNIINIIYE